VGILGEILKFVTTNWRIIVDCFLAILFYLIFYTYFNKFKLNVRQYLVGGLFYLLLFVGMILNLKSVMIISFLILNLFIVAFVNNFRADIKKTLFATNFKKNLPKNVVKIKQEEKDELINQLVAALLTMSTDRIGAIITVERTQNLDEYIKKGVTIRSNVTTELILTIFYPGTALHDGAVVIRGNKIEAASVYFTLTSKPMSGRYGSRHRAAVGISEASDAITFIVSEETGRISFTQDGEIEPINRDSLQKIITELLD
jgi:diadenylate cyclase